MTKPTPEQIDEILPQTQCGLCGFGGCMPYAEALVKQDAAINLCPPGGIKGLIKIAELVGSSAEPFIADMKEKTKPKLVARIREDECIGCTKCIQACPVDAILGAGKLMHSVIQDECTGCELCITPCPVDCIDMLPATELSEDEERRKANQFRTRFNAREARLKQASVTNYTKEVPVVLSNDKKAFVQAALERAKLKKKAVRNN